MDSRIKKLLVGFFTLMLAFTFLSRAAAATVVPKVQVAFAKRGNLTYEVSGTGIVKADADQYIEPEAGYQVGAVSVKEGQEVKEGDLLFSYDMKQLQATEAEQEDDLKKLNLQYRSIGLTAVNSDHSSEKAATLLAVENAQEDVNTARQELEDVKKTVKENKEKAYQEAADMLEETVTSMEAAVKSAKRTVEDSETELSKLLAPEKEAGDVLYAYKGAVRSGSAAGLSSAWQRAFGYYYGEGYEEHLQKTEQTNKELQRAREDLAAVTEKWQNIDLEDYRRYDPDSAVRNAYYEQAAARQAELNAASRAVQDAEGAYEKLTGKDEQLAQALNELYAALVNQTSDADALETSLFQLLTENKTADPKILEAAQTKLQRAREDEAATEEEWKKKQEAAQEKAQELLDDLEAIAAQRYDYSKDERTMKKALQEAERALGAARLAQQSAQEAGLAAEEGEEKQEASEDIERSILRIDLDKKTRELKELQKLILDGGKVHTAVAGVVSVNNLEPGLLLTGQEKLVITTGGYELSMSAEEEAMKHFAAGDTVTVRTGEGKPVTSRIENIELKGQDQKVGFTAILPEGDYRIGSSLEYTLSKESDSYQNCVPIQALRQDLQGTYLLLVREKESVLGTIEEAFRMNVTVLSMDHKTAAVEASLTENDRIITTGSRSFQEGDRVRIYEVE